MRYVDPSTGDTYPLTEARWRADNGHYLNLARRRDCGGRTSTHPPFGVALCAGAPRRAEHAVSLGEGWTPLVDGHWDGAPVRFKLEFMMPTGSFKDRGMTVMVSYLKSCGVDRVLEDSSGNAGASLSAYAAAAGLTCRILVPETASYPKIAQIAACGADVVTIAGSRQDVAEAALRQSAEMFYASHNWQPFFLEGTKTLAYELWEQSGFQAPDNLVVPLGYGSNVLGADRGFAELAHTGEIAAGPRLFGVQAARCAPYAAAFRAGVEHLVPTDVAPTVAEGIATSNPRAWPRCCAPCAAPAAASWRWRKRRSWRRCVGCARRGLYVEPTSAVAAAGLTRLIADGSIRPHERTVLVLTGSGLKASSITGELLNLGARPGA
jgi:threonine synthase